VQDHPTKRDYASDGRIAKRKRKREKLSGKGTIKIKREMATREEGEKREKREKSEIERGCSHSVRERKRGSLPLALIYIDIMHSDLMCLNPAMRT